MFFCKQKAGYGMRSSDWSSDVCSSDLGQAAVERVLEVPPAAAADADAGAPVSVPVAHQRHVLGPAPVELDLVRRVVEPVLEEPGVAPPPADRVAPVGVPVTEHRDFLQIWRAPGREKACASG